VDEVWVVRAGVVPYDEARSAQKRLEAARQAGEVPDLLLLLEHPPVYTKGRRSTADELPMGEDWYRMQGIEVRETDRGGRVTYHGPGQLVGYPIVDLKPHGDDVHLYIRRMERTVIEALADHGVAAGMIPGLTGVWVRRPASDPAAPGVADEEAAGGHSRKIGSIGVHVSRGITTHGFAVNVNNDLQPFEWIVPCGIEGCRVTSLTRERGAEQDLDAFAATIASRFAAVYGREAVEVGVAELAARAAGAAPLLAGAAAALP
jgi:lipoyl(octanoyl) transferase